MMKAYPYWVVSALTLLTAGCGMEGPAPSDAKPAAEATQIARNDTGTKRTPEAKPTAVKAQTTETAKPPADGKNNNDPANAPAGPIRQGRSSASGAAGTAPGANREQVHVGMGEKGRGYGSSYIAVVCASYWQVKERMAINLIQHAMDLYKAENGSFPKTQEEFMQKIIKDNDIKLPVLPEGHKYEYDPKEGQLMVLVPQDPKGP